MTDVDLVILLAHYEQGLLSRDSMFCQLTTSLSPEVKSVPYYLGLWSLWPDYKRFLAGITRDWSWTSLGTSQVTHTLTDEAWQAVRSLQETPLVFRL